MRLAYGEGANGAKQHCTQWGKIVIELARSWHEGIYAIDLGYITSYN
jgi:hypothetical protein